MPKLAQHPSINGRLRAACVAILLLLLGTPTIAADISQRFDVMFIRGYIQHGDAEKFDKAFAEGVKRIFLTSEGGSTLAAIALAKRIAESGLPV